VLSLLRLPLASDCQEFLPVMLRPAYPNSTQSLVVTAALVIEVPITVPVAVVLAVSAMVPLNCDSNSKKCANNTAIILKIVITVTKNVHGAVMMALPLREFAQFIE